MDIINGQYLELDSLAKTLRVNQRSYVMTNEFVASGKLKEYNLGDNIKLHLNGSGKACFMP